MENILSVNNVKKRYGTFEAVKNVSFTLGKGQTLAVLGQNGAGKSTTLKMIYATTPITEGSIILNNVDVSKNPRKAKANIGVVMQDDLLDTSLSVLENMIAHGILFDLSTSQAKQRGKELLEFVGLSRYLKKDVNELSGGMRRRLVLARALINDPKLVILDEPTTGLDIQSRLIFWDKLNALKQQGVSILLTSHYVDEIEKLADQVLIIDHGSIIVQGDVKTMPQEHGFNNIEEMYLDVTHFKEGSGAIEQTIG